MIRNMTRNVTRMTVAIAFVLCFALGTHAVTLIHLGSTGRGAAGRDFIEEKAREFEALHPGVEIQIEVPGSYTNNFTVRWAGGMPPDITEFNEDQGGNYVKENIFLDLRPYLERDPDHLNDILHAALEPSTWLDGSIWMLPSDIYPNVTLYNKNVLEERGLVAPDRLGDDWDWDTFSAYTRRLTTDADGDGTVDFWGTEYRDRMWAQSTLVTQAGGSLVDRLKDPTEVRFNTPETLAALEFIVSLNDAGVFGPNNAFKGGSSAILTTFAPAYLGVVQDSIAFDWGVARPLRGPDNAGTLIAVNGYQIIRTTEHADIAWEWLQFLTTAENQLEYARRTMFAPARQSVLSQYPALIGTDLAAGEAIMFAGMNPNSFHNIMGAPFAIRAETSSLIVAGALRDGESPSNVLQRVQETVTARLKGEL